MISIFRGSKNSLLAVLVAIIVLFGASSCNKKCRSLESSISGNIVSTYDFKDCFIYATFDSVLHIDSDTAFDSYKKSHFIHCNTGSLDAIDFSKYSLFGFKTRTSACNAAFHRNISLDTANKIYHYTVTVEWCGGCGTDLLSTNFVIGPKVPPGYSLKYTKKDP